MSVFVVLSVTIAIAIVAVTVVITVRLVRTAAAMSQGVRTSIERLAPLTEELRDEIAVTQTELERLEAQTERLRGRREQ